LCALISYKALIFFTNSFGLWFVGEGFIWDTALIYGVMFLVIGRAIFFLVKRLTFDMVIVFIAISIL